MGLGSIFSSGCFAELYESSVKSSYGSPFMESTHRVTKEPTGLKLKEEVVDVEHQYMLGCKQKKDNLEIKVIDSQNKIIRVSDEVIKKEKFDEYKYKTIEEPNIGLFVAGGLGLLIGGLGIVGQADPDERDYDPKVMAAIGGVCFGLSFAIKTKTKSKSRTGRVEYREIDRSYDVIETKKRNLGSFAGGNVNVRLSSKHIGFEDTTLITNSQGVVTVGLKENIPYWAFSKTELEREVRKSLSSKISGKSLDFIVRQFIGYTRGKSYPIKMETVAKSGFKSTVKNDKVSFDVKGYEVNPSALETILGK